MSKKNRWVLLVLVLLALIAILIGYVALHAVTTDTKAPKITLTAEELSVSVLDPQEALLQGITAADDRDGDVTDLIVVESMYGITKDNRVTVTYAAFDRSGNVAKQERQVHLSDYEAPRFTLSGALAFEDGTNFDILSLVGAQDLRDGNLQHKLKATSMSTAGSITEIGTHEIQFRVTNSLGDTQHLMLPLEIYPKDRYQAEMTLKEYLIYLPAGSSFNARDYVDGFSLFGEQISLADVKVSLRGEVDQTKPGVYPIAYTASYTVNDRVYMAYTKLIVIVEG